MKSLVQALLLIFMSLGCSSPSNQESPAAKAKQPVSSDDTVNQNGTDSADQSTPGQQDGKTPATGGSDDGAQAGGCRTFQDSYDTHTTVAGPVHAPLIGSINITVDADATVKIESAAASGSLAIDGKVTNAQPALARPTAERGLSAYSDPMRMTYASTTEQAGLSGWQGLDCLVVGIKSLKSSKFDYTFEPALPFLVPAAATGQGFARTISGIKSTINAHFEQNNGAKLGSYQGKATLTQTGKTYHITYDFGKAPGIFATPFAEIEYQLGDDGKYSKITAWLWMSQTDKLPVPLSR